MIQGKLGIDSIESVTEVLPTYNTQIKDSKSPARAAMQLGYELAERITGQRDGAAITSSFGEFYQLLPWFWREEIGTDGRVIFCNHEGYRNLRPIDIEERARNLREHGHTVEIYDRHTANLTSESFTGTLPDVLGQLKLRLLEVAYKAHPFVVWINGRKRDSEARQDLPFIETAHIYGEPVIKVNPVAQWGLPFTKSYMARNKIPLYGSNGDIAKENGKRECGLHTQGEGI